MGGARGRAAGWDTAAATGGGGGGSGGGASACCCCCWYWWWRRASSGTGGEQATGAVGGVIGGVACDDDMTAGVRHTHSSNTVTSHASVPSYTCHTSSMLARAYLGAAHNDGGRPQQLLPSIKGGSSGGLQSPGCLDEMGARECVVRVMAVWEGPRWCPCRRQPQTPRPPGESLGVGGWNRRLRCWASEKCFEQTDPPRGPPTPREAPRRLGGPHLFLFFHVSKHAPALGGPAGEGEQATSAPAAAARCCCCRHAARANTSMGPPARSCVLWVDGRLGHVVRRGRRWTAPGQCRRHASGLAPRRVQLACAASGDGRDPPQCRWVGRRAEQRPQRRPGTSGEINLTSSATLGGVWSTQTATRTLHAHLRPWASEERRAEK